MYRDRQRLEWPNRRVDPMPWLVDRSRTWRKWAYDHLVAVDQGEVNRSKPLILAHSKLRGLSYVGSYYALGRRNVWVGPDFDLGCGLPPTRGAPTEP